MDSLKNASACILDDYTRPTLVTDKADSTNNSSRDSGSFIQYMALVWKVLREEIISGRGSRMGLMLILMRGSCVSDRT